MIFIAMLLGLRCSEILGLRWEDFDIKRHADTDEIFTGGARRLLPGKRRPLCHPERWNRKLVSWPLSNRVKMSGLPKTRVSNVAWGARPCRWRLLVSPLVVADFAAVPGIKEAKLLGPVSAAVAAYSSDAEKFRGAAVVVRGEDECVVVQSEGSVFFGRTE